MKVSSLRQLKEIMRSEERLLWNAPVYGPAPGSFPLLLTTLMLSLVISAWGGGAQIAAGVVAFVLIKLMIDCQDDANEYVVLTDMRLLCIDRRGRIKAQFDVKDIDFRLDNDVELTVTAREGDLTTKWRCNPRSALHLKHLEQSWTSLGRDIEKRYLVKRDTI